MAGGRSGKAKPAVSVPATSSQSLMKTLANPGLKNSPKKGGSERSEVGSTNNASRLSMKDYEFSDSSPTKDSSSQKKKEVTGSNTPSRNLTQTLKRPTNVDSSDSSEDSDDEDALRNLPKTSSNMKLNSKKIPSPSKTESVKRSLNYGIPKNSNAEDSGNTSYESLDEEADEEVENYVNVPKEKPIAGSNSTKLEDLRHGNEIAMTMPHEDLQIFITKLKAICEVLDRSAASQRALSFDWNSVAFKDYSGDDLRVLWTYLQSKRRTRRNMWEYANEVEHETKKSNYKNRWIKSHPDFPVKPPGCGGALQMYAHKRYVEVKEKTTEAINYMQFYKVCIQEFNSLPQSEKLKYADMSSKVSTEFEQKLAKFYTAVGYKPEKLAKKSSSGTRTRTAVGSSRSAGSSRKHVDMYTDAPVPPLRPAEMFAASKIEKLDPPPLPEELDEIRVQYVSKYLKLKDSKQAKVINSVIEAAGDYLKEVEEYQKLHPHYSVPKMGKLSNILTKREIETWERECAKRPPKPPQTGAEILEEELREKGGFNPEDYNSEVAAKQALEAKFKALSWYEKSAYNIKLLQVGSEYCQAINKYYEDLPPIMKPLILTTIEKKYRAPVLIRESPSRSPKKRKPETAAEPENAVAPAKKSKKEKKIEEAAIAQAEAEEAAAREALEAANTASSSPEKKKKKKKLGVLTAALRGIFDGRPSLGRTYTIIYHYTKRLSVDASWIEKVDEIGIVDTALLMLESYINLSDLEKFVNIEATLTLQSTGFLQIKQDGSEEGDVKPFFLNEPSLPHLDARRLFIAEEKDQRRGAKHPSWADAKPETKMLYLKKHYGTMKTYVNDFQNFVLSMTPHDLALYTATKATEWEKKNKVTKEIKDNPNIVPIADVDTLAEISDGYDNDMPPLISVSSELGFPGHAQIENTNVSKSVFDNSLFLDQLYNT